MNDETKAMSGAEAPAVQRFQAALDELPRHVAAAYFIHDPDKHGLSWSARLSRKGWGVGNLVFDGDGPVESVLFEPKLVRHSGGQRVPLEDVAGELSVSFADLLIGSLNAAKSGGDPEDVSEGFRLARKTVEGLFSDFGEACARIIAENELRGIIPARAGGGSKDGGST